MKKRKRIQIPLKKRADCFKTLTWRELRLGSIFWCDRSNYRLYEEACLERQAIMAKVKDDEDELKKVPKEIEKCWKCPQGKLVKILVGKKRK